MSDWKPLVDVISSCEDDNDADAIMGAAIELARSRGEINEFFATLLSDLDDSDLQAMAIVMAAKR